MRPALTPAFRELRTWAGPVAPYERIDLTSDVERQRVRHPYPNHARRKERRTVREQRSDGVQETEVVEGHVWAAVIR